MGDLSRHFSSHEFTCKCGRCDTSHQWTPLSLIAILEMLHVNLSYEYKSQLKIIVNSSWRCPPYNEKVGGKSSSKHLQGIAADIKCEIIFGTEWVQVAPKIVGMYVDEIFPRKLGIGIYDTFTHIDTREQRGRW